MCWLFKISDRVCLPIAVLGIVVYYATTLEISLYICAGWLVLHSILNCIYGGQNNLNTEIMTFVVGAVVVWIFKIDFWRCISVAFCYAEIVCSIAGIILIAGTVFPKKKEK